LREKQDGAAREGGWEGFANVPLMGQLKRLGGWICASWKSRMARLFLDQATKGNWWADEKRGAERWM